MSKILLVDDDSINISILKEIFADSHQLASAFSGQEALDLVTAFCPDLILLDIMMPEMDGFEVCKRIKADPTTKDIPIIFLTALTKLDEKIKGFAYGGADYITKPFDAEEVEARAGTHIRLREAQKTIRQHNEQLEQLLEERTRDLIRTERQAAFSLLIQGIIHNLKGPLTAVMGLSDVIMTSTEKELADCNEKTTISASDIAVVLKKTKRNAEVISSAGHELHTMINALMSKSRSDKSGDMSVVDINQLLKQEIEFLNGDLRFKHHTKKKISLHPGPLPTHVVPSEIAQIFSNLVRNAMDATHSAKTPHLIIESGTHQSYAWFSVSDNGPGIPQEDRTKVFDPFFSTKPSASKAKPGEPIGTGLGLHTVAMIVQSYGGRTQILDSSLDGACIKIFIPLHSGSND